MRLWSQVIRPCGIAASDFGAKNSPQDCLVHILNFALYVAFVTVDKSSTDDFFPQQVPLTNHYIKQKTQTNNLYSYACFSIYINQYGWEFFIENFQSPLIL